MRNQFIFIIALCSNLSVIAGGPWLVKKKSSFLQVQSTFPIGTYNQLFLEDGSDPLINREVLDVNFQVYLEFGISDKLNIVTTLPAKYISTGAEVEDAKNPILLPAGSLLGLSNYKFALKYGLLNKKIKVAISLQTSWNTINKDLDKGLATGFNANIFSLYGHVGGSITNRLYLFTDVGYSNMTHNYSDYIDAHMELGYQLKKPLWISGTIDIKESLKNGSYSNANLQQTGFYTNNQEYFAYGIKGSYETPNKVGFTIASFGALSGNQVAHALTVSVGIYKKW